MDTLFSNFGTWEWVSLAASCVQLLCCLSLAVYGGMTLLRTNTEKRLTTLVTESSDSKNGEQFRQLLRFARGTTSLMLLLIVANVTANGAYFKIQQDRRTAPRVLRDNLVVLKVINDYRYVLAEQKGYWGDDTSATAPAAIDICRDWPKPDWQAGTKILHLAYRRMPSGCWSLNTRDSGGGYILEEGK